MLKISRFFSISLCLMVLLSLIACTSKENEFKEIDFSKKNFIDDYSEYLYFNNNLFGVSSEIVHEEVFKDRIGKKLGEIKNISNFIVNEGDVGLKGNKKEILFKSGDGIYQVKGTSEKLIVLIKTSKGYLHTKLVSFSNE